MNPRLIICFLILASTVKTIANSDDVQITENNQNVILQQEKIKMPWSDCTEINKISEKKFSFSQKQIKKENKVYEEYRKFYLNHNSPADFSMKFVEKENENAKTEMLIKFILSVLETNKGIKSSNSPTIKFQEKQFLLQRELEDQINYRKKYDNNLLSLPK